MKKPILTPWQKLCSFCFGNQDRVEEKNHKSL